MIDAFTLGYIRPLMRLQATGSQLILRVGKFQNLGLRFIHQVFETLKEIQINIRTLERMHNLITSCKDTVDNSLMRKRRK